MGAHTGACSRANLLGLILLHVICSIATTNATCSNSDCLMKFGREFRTRVWDESVFLEFQTLGFHGVLLVLLFVQARIPLNQITCVAHLCFWHG